MRLDVGLDGVLIIALLATSARFALFIAIEITRRRALQRTRAWIAGIIA